jgi:hypothetical protein
MTTSKKGTVSAEMAAETPDAGLQALGGARKQRAGFCLLIAGDCLDEESALWTDKQRAEGVWTKGIYLGASEEEDVYVDAARQGKAAAVALFQIKYCFYAIAETVGHNEQGQPMPGPWKLVPVLDRGGYWQALGSKGRSLFSQAFQRAHIPGEESRQIAAQSFRQVT